MNHVLTNIRLPLAVVLGLVLAYSASVKLIDLDGFARIIDNYRLLPEWSVNSVAVFVAALEAVLAAALVFGPDGRDGQGGYRQAGALLAGAVFLVFAALAGVAVARGLDIACGCFSTNPKSAVVSWLTVGRNLLLAACCVVVFAARVKEAKAEGVDSP